MKKVIAFGLVSAPMLLLAAGPISDVGSAFTAIQSWMRTLTTIIFAAAVLYFLYGVFNFIKNPGDATKREEGRTQIIWGIIGLTVMASIYGLIGFLGSSTVGIGGNTISAPALPL
ncbi:MAG: hypothetical protein HY228_00985 [Candidatus Yonathbacteria bacterium]|nr:hypothetical protein [Candidatus Yonathbacteria bacterium]